MFFLITLMCLYFYFKGDAFKSVLFFLFLLTDGFQLIPEFIFKWGVPIYGKDYALVFVLVIFFSETFIKGINFYKNKIFLAILFFLLYTVLALIIDLTWFSPSFIGSLLIYRVNLFFLSYFWLSTISTSTYSKLFKVILIITVFQSLICLLQIPFGVKLLTGGGIAEYTEMGFKWIRFTNLPYFLLPCLFILMLEKKTYIPYRKTMIFLFIITILFTLTRTLIIGLFITICFAIFLGLLNGQKKLIIILLSIFVISSPLIGSRLISSTQDFNNAINQNEISTNDGMTFTYRILHTTERYLYISKSLKGIFFGIGFIHERNFPDDTFLIGHVDYDNDYRITQLEQDDISWSNLFLRFGIIGSIIYLFVFYTFLNHFYKLKNNSIASSGFLFLIMSFILSFSSGRFSQADFFIIPIMFLFSLNSIYKREFSK